MFTDRSLVNSLPNILYARCDCYRKVIPNPFSLASLSLQRWGRQSFPEPPLQLEIVLWHHYGQWNARRKLLDRWFEKDMSFLVKKKRQVESSNSVPCFLPLKMVLMLGAFASILWLWREGKRNHRATNLNPLH